MPQIVCPICHRQVHFHDRNKHQLKHIKKAKELGKITVTAPTRQMMVRCKKCGNEYPTRSFGMDEATFNNPTITVSGQKETCPICGKESTHDKQDYFFK